MNRIDTLKGMGVEFTVAHRYEGEPGKDRHRVELPEIITSVKIPLTAEEWCRVAQRDEDMYVGGCCANMSLVQDHINGAFRDGGWIDSQDLLTIGELSRDHDGFEWFQQMDDEKFKRGIASWSSLVHDPPDEGVSDVWGIIGIVYNAVEPFLQPRRLDLPQSEPSPWQQAVRGISYVGWEIMMADFKDGQHEAVGLEKRARLVGPLREILKELEASDQRFEGFALVEKGTNEVLTNRLGVCLYNSPEEAQRWLDILQRYDQQEDEEEAGRQRKLDYEAEIVPAIVTVANGVEIRRENASR